MKEEQLREEWKEKCRTTDFELFDDPVQSQADWWLEKMASEHARIRELVIKKFDEVLGEEPFIDDEGILTALLGVTREGIVDLETTILESLES